MHYGYSPEPGSENNQYKNSLEGSVCAVQNWWATTINGGNSRALSFSRSM